MSYWDTAYKIYNFLLTFSTAGLPLAISKLTSEAYTQGRENEKRKIFRTAIWLFFALGLVGSLLMFFQADLLVGFLRNENAMRRFRLWRLRCSACAFWPVCGAILRGRET